MLNHFLGGLGFWVLFLASLVWSQTAPQATSAQPTQTTQEQKPAGGTPAATPQQQDAAGKKGDGSAGGSPAATQEETKISPTEAEALFRSLDDILRFASKDTSLPIKHEVKRRLINRDEVAAFVEQHTSEDEDAKRLRRSEVVLKKFGLLPRDFDLGPFLVALLREQVAGYYDPKTKTVNLLDWVDPDRQKPVMAHELTHALQDQSFNLEKYMKAGNADLEKKKDLTPADIENDEINTARQAVVEGQAMVVLIDYMLAPMGQSIQDSPQLLQALKDGMLVGTADSPQFQNAPIYLKEALTFPYRYGIDFVAELLAKGGKEKAYAGLFENPPYTTRQIMEPKTYLSGERLEPMRLPEFKDVFKGYERFDVGAVGELDVAVLIDQYAGVGTSRALYPHWRGGYYYAARLKGDAAAPLGLLYVSRWSSPEKAAEFAAVYAKALTQRYRHVHGDTRESTKPVLDRGVLETLTGKHSWLTEDGSVVIDAEGDTVMVTESLDLTVTEKAEQELFRAVAAAGR
jgi:hypothetical protein